MVNFFRKVKSTEELENLFLNILPRTQKGGNFQEKKEDWEAMVAAVQSVDHRTVSEGSGFESSR